MSDNQTTEEKHPARWVIELNTDCPQCGEYVDLLEAQDFWDGRHKLQPGMSASFDEAAAGLEVVCPKCDHTFEVDCEY